MPLDNNRHSDNGRQVKIAPESSQPAGSSFTQYIEKRCAQLANNTKLTSSPKSKKRTVIISKLKNYTVSYVSFPSGGAVNSPQTE